MTPDSPFQFSRYTPRDLEIIDTTLREGSQTSLLHDHYRYFFSQTDKTEIVQALIIYGVKFIELFAPIVSPQERDDMAAIQAIKGNTEACFNWLEKALDNGFLFYSWLEIDPLFESIREEPKFLQFIKEVRSRINMQGKL